MQAGTCRSTFSRVAATWRLTDCLRDSLAETDRQIARQTHEAIHGVDDDDDEDEDDCLVGCLRLRFVNFGFETRFQLNFIASYALLPFAFMANSLRAWPFPSTSHLSPLPCHEF